MAAILNNLNVEGRSIEFDTTTLDTKNILQMLERLKEKVARIDALVSSGIAQQSRPVEDAGHQDMRRVLDQIENCKERMGQYEGTMSHLFYCG